MSTILTLVIMNWTLSNLLLVWSQTATNSHRKKEEHILSPPSKTRVCVHSQTGRHYLLPDPEKRRHGGQKRRTRTEHSRVMGGRGRWLRMISCDRKSHCGLRSQISLYPPFRTPLAPFCSTNEVTLKEIKPSSWWNTVFLMEAGNVTLISSEK